MAKKEAPEKPAKAPKPEAKGGAKPDAKGGKPGRGEGRAASPKGDATPAASAGPARLHVHYREQVVPELMKKFGYESVMQVPRLAKITLNMGGQKPVITKARKSIATFKIRAGYPIGCMVTLRGARMYEFLDRFVSVAMPRIRDFRGVSSRAFDGRGNYTIGVKEQIIFPEIEYDKIDALRGLNISITTTAKSDDEARALLAGFRFPFKS